MVRFGTSGIRGIYGETVTEDLAKRLGATLSALGVHKATVAMDTRSSGPSLKEAFKASYAGNVTDFGVAPTPLLCFGTRKVSAHRGIMITASHNPSAFNGFKVWDEKGMAISHDEEQRIEQALDEEHPAHAGEVSEQDIVPQYLATLKEAIPLDGKMKVLVDPGNGAACNVTTRLLQEWGFPTTVINGEPDGRFPNRLPEPNASNLQKTMQAVTEASVDVGFAHDGDADRMMALDEKGQVVDFDRFLFYLSSKMIEKTGIKRIVTTVDASLLLDELDADVVRTKVGDTFVAQELAKQKAAFGGEPSGSYIFPSFGLWPDGIQAVFQTLQFLEQDKQPLSKLLSQYPTFHHTRMKFPCAEGKKQKAMASLASQIPETAEITSVDGLRAKFDSFALLIRPSGTEEYLRLNVESKDKGILKEQQAIWEQKIKEVLK